MLHINIPDSSINSNSQLDIIKAQQIDAAQQHKEHLQEVESLRPTGWQSSGPVSGPVAVVACLLWGSQQARCLHAGLTTATSKLLLKHINISLRSHKDSAVLHN